MTKNGQVNLEETARASTGVAGLDDVLGGGLPEGHVYLLEGTPGTGKTTVGLQFLLTGAAEGQSVLYVTLSESEREIRGVALAHQWSLEGVTIFEYTPQEESLRPEDQYSAFHPSEIELFDTTQTILKKIEELHPTRVVFDSLSEIRLLARDSLRYRRQILALKQYFANRDCTVLLLDDQTATPTDRQLRSIVHGVVELEMLPRDFGRIRRRLSVVKLRGSSFREGYHDYTITTGGVVVFPRLISAEHRHNPMDELLSSGIPELDALWRGGIERGSSTLLLGPAGVGKSTLSMAYAVAAAKRGEHVSAFLFDESVNTVLKRVEGLGIDARPYCADGRLAMEQVDPAELAPGEFVQRVRDAVEKRNARMVLLDSLNGFLAAMPGERYLTLHMHELLSFLHQKGVSTFMILAQMGVLNPVGVAPVDLSYLADNMMLLRYFESRGEVSKAISVVKKRSSAHEATIRELRIQAGSIAVSEPLTTFDAVMSGSPRYIGARIPGEDSDAFTGQF